MRVRRLILMRHAKSSWQHDLSDHARPLNERGRLSATDVAGQLVAHGWVPEVVLSSDSTRTTETWQYMESAFMADIPVSWDPRLYLAGLGTIQKIIGGLPDSVNVAMMLGHNPGCEGMVSWLSGVPTEFTTANAALLQWQDLSWRQALSSPSAAQLVALLRPESSR